MPTGRAPANRPRHEARSPRMPSFRNIAPVLSWILVATFIALGTWSSYWAYQRNDQYQLITLGQTVYDGGRLYVDAWENKPPGVAWINALGIAMSGGALSDPALALDSGFQTVC